MMIHEFMVNDKNGIHWSVEGRTEEIDAHKPCDAFVTVSFDIDAECVGYISARLYSDQWLH